MALIYEKPRNARGMSLEKAMAYHEDVQKAVKHEAELGASIAEVVLAQHKHDGHSEIQMEQHGPDSYVVLSDERGLLAAMSIEFGRKLPDGGHTEPVHALHAAFPEARWKDD